MYRQKNKVFKEDNMAERALAHIEKIEWVRPIEGQTTLNSLVFWVGYVQQRKMNLKQEIQLFILRLTVSAQVPMKDFLSYLKRSLKLRL